MQIFYSYGGLYSTYIESMKNMVGGINSDGLIIDNSLNIYASFHQKTSSGDHRWVLLKFQANQSALMPMIYFRQYSDTDCSYGSAGSALGLIQGELFATGTICYKNGNGNGNQKPLLMLMNIKTDDGKYKDYMAYEQNDDWRYFGFDRISGMTGGGSKIILSACGNNDRGEINNMYNANKIMFASMIYDPSKDKDERYTQFQAKYYDGEDKYHCLSTQTINYNQFYVFLVREPYSSQKVYNAKVKFGMSKIEFDYFAPYQNNNNMLYYAKYTSAGVVYYGGAAYLLTGLAYIPGGRVAYISKFDPANYTCLQVSSGYNDSDWDLKNMENSFKEYRFSDNNDPNFSDKKDEFAVSNFTNTNSYVKTLAAFDHSLSCPSSNPYYFSTVPPIPSVTYYIGQGYLYVVHPDFSSSAPATCTDQYISYQVASQSAAALPGIVKYIASTKTVNYTSITYTDAGTYNLKITATLNNNKTATSYYVLNVIYECGSVSVISAAIPNFWYDISSQEQLSAHTFNWNSTVPSSTYCGTSNIQYSIKHYFNGAYIAPDAEVFLQSATDFLVNTTNSVKVGYYQLLVGASFYGQLKVSQWLNIYITNNCTGTTFDYKGGIADQIYYLSAAKKTISFTPWTESIGVCGPITYELYWNSNNTLVSGTEPITTNFATAYEIYVETAQQALINTYQMRLQGKTKFGPVIGSKLFNVQILQDPCSLAVITPAVIPDQTLYINKTGQTAILPVWTSDKPECINWNFTMEMSNGTALPSPTFTFDNQPSITLTSVNPADKAYSILSVKISGWFDTYNNISQSTNFNLYINYDNPTDCPAGQYYNTSLAVCKDCISPCTTCTSDLQCTWCIDTHTYFESNNSCILDSVVNSATDCTILVDGLCRKCPQYCQTCTGSVCTACLSGYTLANGQCSIQKLCPEGFRLDQATNICQACSSQCSQCSSTQCSYCNPGYNLDTTTNTCVASCPSGSHLDADSKACLICQNDCLTCTGTNYTCNSCKPGSYLLGNTCVKRCPYMGYYQNAVTNKCDPCDSLCTICIGSTTDCVSCVSTANLMGRQCVDPCPDNFYGISSKKTCIACDPKCKKCTSYTADSCQACNTGNYLFETTCASTCPNPRFPNPLTLTCDTCAYYCEQCSDASSCQLCKTGYKQIPNSCVGEYYLQTTSTYSLNVPLNTAKTTGYDPVHMTVEIWFKADSISSTNNEIILGATPFKLRKKANLPQIQLNYKGLSNYCETTDVLLSDTWYHFAWAVSESDSGDFACYLNGKSVPIGSSSASMVTQNVTALTEITFGSSQTLTSETNFNGLLREFRWWGVRRSEFYISGFMNVEYDTIPSTMIAYWKLKEKNDGTETQYTDYASTSAALKKTPVGKTVAQSQTMKEQYLKLCPMSFYPYFNTTLGYYECLACESTCKNCIGPTALNCTECNTPLTLLSAEYKCILVDGCPDGYYLNQNTGLCAICYTGCLTCVNSPTQCPKCKPKYFREYKGQSCVNECPSGMYGVYKTQQCLFSPIVTSITPASESNIAFGTYIDLLATYKLQNSENETTFTFGWTVIRLSDGLDISDDAIKTYASSDLTKVHVDNNIVQANYDYSITFWLKGNSSLYNNFYSDLTHQIFLGIPPKDGQCNSNLQSGVADVTEFTFSSPGWVDPNGIAQYKFLYSMDNGETYLPMTTERLNSNSMSFTFPAIFQSINVRIKCEAINPKGFSGFQTTQIVVQKKTNINPIDEMNKLTQKIEKATEEAELLKYALQIQLISQNLGDLKALDKYDFDPKIEREQCSSVCQNSGQCLYQPYTKKYHCSCGSKAGQNCTFADNSTIKFLQNLTYNVSYSYAYTLFTEKTYQIEFMKLITTFKDQLTIKSYGAIIQIMKERLIADGGTLYSQNQMQQLLVILSNLLEFIEMDTTDANLTSKFTPNSASAQNHLDNLLDTMQVFNSLRQNTLLQINNITSQLQFTTRMLTYRQMLISQDQIINVQASNTSLKDYQTLIKISPANFQNITNSTNLQLEKKYVVEAVEYAINPYQLKNLQNIATNIFEVTFFNFTNKAQVNVQNLTNGFEISFPVKDNRNFSTFADDYALLNPFKTSHKLKRQQMVKNSLLACSYWDISKWSTDGCKFLSIESGKVKCECNHLTSFGPQFITPVLTDVAVEVDKGIKKAEVKSEEDITLDELVKWPLSDYFQNLQELQQHKQPTIVSLFIKPGLYVVILFWFMYLSSLVYYTGKDRLKRSTMIKSQNRDDLAEIKDNEVQCLDIVIKELIARDQALGVNSKQALMIEHQHQATQEGDHISENPQSHLTGRQNHQQPKGTSRKLVDTATPLVYEEMSKELKKNYKRRARRKVFGKVGSPWQRAKRFYKRVYKKSKLSAQAKMMFFNEELKNNLWFGLMAKTSKIAPRHTRLAVMYLNIAIHLMLSSMIYMFKLQEIVDFEISTFKSIAVAGFCIFSAWIVTIPVALIFRMPMKVRKQIQGIKTKKINKAFPELDRQMGCRYAIGYFISLIFYCMMTVIVMFFTYYYPTSYCMDWLTNLLLLYMIDMLLLTFGFAGLQLLNAIISLKLKCWFNVWATLEVFRYLKNLRG